MSLMLTHRRFFQIDRPRGFYPITETLERYWNGHCWTKRLRNMYDSENEWDDPDWITDD